MDMTDSMAVSVTALDAQRQRLNVISSNLANALFLSPGGVRSQLQSAAGELLTFRKSSDPSPGSSPPVAPNPLLFQPWGVTGAPPARDKRTCSNRSV